MSYDAVTTRNGTDTLLLSDDLDAKPSLSNRLDGFIRSVLPSTATPETVQRISTALTSLTFDGFFLLFAILIAVTSPVFACVYSPAEVGNRVPWAEGWATVWTALVDAAKLIVETAMLPLWAIVWAFGWGLFLLAWTCVGMLGVVFVIGPPTVAYAMRAFSPSVFFSFSAKAYNNPLLRLLDYSFLPAIIHAMIYTNNPSLFTPWTPYLVAFWGYLALSSLFDFSLLRGALRTVIWVVWQAKGWETSAVDKDKGEEKREERTRLLEEENERLREELRRERTEALPSYRPHAWSSDSLV